MAKKKEVIEGDLQVKLLKIRKNLEDKFGEGIIKEGNIIEETSFISTGSLSLDYALGGGFPKGRFSIITGAKHTGKSFVCYKTLIEY